MKPEYKSWAMEGILLAANHDTSGLDSKIQPWTTDYDATNPAHVKTLDGYKALDRFNMFVAVAAYLTTEVGKGDTIGSAGGELNKKIIENPKFPISIGIIVCSVFSVFITGIVASFLHSNSSVNVYIILINSITFGLFTIAIILHCLISSNYIDKATLRNKGKPLEIEPKANQPAGTNAKNSNDVNILDATNQNPEKSALKTAVGKGYDKSEVKVEQNAVPNVKGLAKANITSLLDIDFQPSKNTAYVFGPNRRWYHHPPGTHSATEANKDKAGALYNWAHEHPIYWNILDPKYEAWSLPMILGAANNENTTETNLGKIGYKYDTQAATENPTGSGKYPPPAGATEVKAEVDLGKRWDLVVDKFNGDDGVSKKLDQAKNSITNPADVILTPLIISSVMAGLSVLGIFIGLSMIWSMETLKLYVLIGTLFSIFSISSILFGVLNANKEDKVNLKAVDIQKTHLEYTNIEKYHTGADFDNLNEGQNPPSCNTVDANTFAATDKVYFQVTADGQGNPNPPTVQVKQNSADISAQTEGIAEVNVIALWILIINLVMIKLQYDRMVDGVVFN